MIRSLVCSHACLLGGASPPHHAARVGVLAVDSPADDDADDEDDYSISNGDGDDNAYASHSHSRSPFEELDNIGRAEGSLTWTPNAERLVFDYLDRLQNPPDCAKAKFVVAPEHR